MMCRRFVLASLLFLVSCVSVAQLRANDKNAETKPGLDSRPNIVVFFIDDLGYHDLGCYGSTFYDTPNIDALATSGVRMTNFYSANPVCSPTRVAMVTGKAPQRIGVTQWLDQPNKFVFPEEEITIGEAFQSAGYQTAYFGKWHLGDLPQCHPKLHGFGHTVGVNKAGAPGSYFFPYKRKNKKNKADFWDVPDFEDGKDGDYLTDRLTDRAVEFIDASTSSENHEPFFLMLGQYAVHTPIQGPPEGVAKYKAKRKELYGDSKTPFTEHMFESRSRGRQDDPGMGAMVNSLDENVGKVMNKLAQADLLENTIIVFTSDNGGLSTLGNKRFGPTSCFPLRAGKGWTYEGGIKIPTIISWKGKLAPSECSMPGITMDFYPTLLELARLPENQDQCLDGISLAKVLADPSSAEAKSADRFLAWTYPHNHGSNHRPSQAARQGNWKLIRHIDETTADEDRLELYDLAADPGESTNVIRDHQKVANSMVKRLDQWLETTMPALAK